MGDPAHGARDCEHHGEHRAGYPDRAVDNARVEIYIWIELARDEVIVLEHDLLEAQRKLKKRIVRAAERGQNLVAHRANDLGARIEILVDAMAEAHQAIMARFVLRHRE